MAEVITSRLPSERAQRVVPQLTAPAFLPLRNPYLLERYIAVYGNRLGALREIIAPVEIDALLDDRVEKALTDAARMDDCFVTGQGSIAIRKEGSILNAHQWYTLKSRK